MTRMDKLKTLFMQAVKFGLVGVVNTLIDTGVFTLLMLVPFFKAHYVIAQAIGYCAGIANSLIMNKRWTFSQREPMSKKQLALFLAVNLAAFGVSTAVLVLTQERLGLGRLLGKVIAVVCSLGVNFVGNKLLVFNK